MGTKYKPTTALALAALATGVVASQPAPHVSFRLIPINGPYFNPFGLIEGAPDVFYAVGGWGTRVRLLDHPQGNHDATRFLSAGSRSLLSH